MLKRLVIAAILLAAAGLTAFWFLTAPILLDETVLAAVQTGDPERGRRMFWAGGCVSCHANPGAEGEDRLKLAGGLALKTDFGTFVAPNISPHLDDGIGRWSADQFANAMMRGVSPSGQHYFPAFPYSSYARMAAQDVIDLFAFIKTLPPVAGKAPDHELALPFSWRRGVGLWKRLHLRTTPIVPLSKDAPPAVMTGRYLVEGPGHCGECHTPRDVTGGSRYDQWLSGAAAAEGDGTVPDITPGDGGIGGWSASDIAYYLESGFTPDFDSVGGAMVAVQKNMAELTKEDRDAIAAYLKALPAPPSVSR